MIDAATVGQRALFSPLPVATHRWALRFVTAAFMRLSVGVRVTSAAPYLGLHRGGFRLNCRAHQRVATSITDGIGVNSTGRHRVRADRPGRGDTAGLTLLPFAARRSAIDAGTGGRLVLRKAADGVAGRLGLFAAGMWSDFDELRKRSVKDRGRALELSMRGDGSGLSELRGRLLKSSCW